MRRAPESIEDLPGKVTELLRPDLTHGQVVNLSAHLGVHGQPWFGQQFGREGPVDQGSPDCSINLMADLTLVGQTRCVCARPARTWEAVSQCNSFAPINRP